MLIKSFVIALLTPSLAFGFCPFQQQSFPTQQQDEQHAVGVRIRELQTERTNLERQIPQLNSQIQQTRNSLNYYLRAPWADAVIAHMDNGFDCCHAAQATAMNKAEKNRYPAGADYNTAPPTGGSYSEVVDPMPYYDEPTPAETTSPTPTYETPSAPSYSGSDTSCYGYSQDFCQPRWGHNEAPSNGGLCLQTGFAATNAWYNASCRSGGRVNPGICGDARISHYPNDYQQCVQILNEYYRLSRTKRNMSGQLQAYSDQIRTLNQRGRSFGSTIGGILRTVGPFLLMYAISQQSQSSVRQQYQNYRPSYNGGSIGQPNSLSGRYGGSPAPNFYGADYGHPFQSGGIAGQLLPAMMSGAFGCSIGSSGSGLETVLPFLFGGSSGSGSMPYQPGGINGGFPGYQGNNNYNQGNGWIGPARPVSGNQTNYLGQERNAVFYDMMGNAQQRIYNNYAETNQLSQMMGGMGGNSLALPGMSLNGNLSLGMGTPFAPASQGTFMPGIDSTTLMQSLMGGANTNFNLQSVPAGF